MEYEQNGEDRAKYGTELLMKLADKLSGKEIKGLYERNLRNCRQFYHVYPEISQVLSGYALPDSIWRSATAISHKELKEFINRDIKNLM